MRMHMIVEDGEGRGKEEEGQFEPRHSEAPKGKGATGEGGWARVGDRVKVSKQRGDAKKGDNQSKVEVGWVGKGEGKGKALLYWARSYEGCKQDRNKGGGSKIVKGDVGERGGWRWRQEPSKDERG